MSEVVGQASAKYHVGVIRRLFSECCRGFGRGSEFEDLAAGVGAVGDVEPGEIAFVDELVEGEAEVGAGEDIEIRFTGLRPGEKMYEELLIQQENLEKTANKMIFIEKPTYFNEEIFERQLEKLIAAAKKESSDIRREIREIVGTYRAEGDEG